MKTRSIVLAAAFALSACGNPSNSKAQEGEFAQPTRTAPADAAGMKSSFAPVVRSAAPAVVNISARSVQRVQADPYGRQIQDLRFMIAPPQSVDTGLSSVDRLRAEMAAEKGPAPLPLTGQEEEWIRSSLHC